MITKLWNKWKNSRDEKLLAKFKARDAELGTPTKETLNDRAAEAADKGYWKTALAAVEAGADVNAPLQWVQVYNSISDRLGGGLGGGRLAFEENYSLTFLAIKQNNPQALQSLLEKGADTGFIGSSSVNERTHKYSLAEYAALNGSSLALDVVLEKGNPSQAALDGALAITATTKEYLSMTETLLIKGAKGFDAALRKAEITDNKKAILLIRKAEQKAAPTAEAPSAFDASATIRVEFGGGAAPANAVVAPAPAPALKNAPGTP